MHGLSCLNISYFLLKNMDKNRKNTDTATESITSQNIEKKKNRDRLEMKPKPYRTTITVAPTPREASEQYSQVPKPSLIKERKKDLWYETSWLNSFSDKAGNYLNMAVLKVQYCKMSRTMPRKPRVR